MKRCRICQEEKPLTEFHKHNSSKDRKSPYCKPCAIAKASRHVKENYTYEKSRLLTYKRHGITEEIFLALLKLQNELCAICKNKPVKSLHIDHDHTCCVGAYSCGKCVRGLLCGDCNKAIGLLGENIDTFYAAVEYIKHA